MRFYIGKDWKFLDMDYGIAMSKEGKMKIEKAHGLQFTVPCAFTNASDRRNVILILNCLLIMLTA